MTLAVQHCYCLIKILKYFCFKIFFDRISDPDTDEDGANTGEKDQSQQQNKTTNGTSNNPANINVSGEISLLEWLNCNICN